MNVKNILINFLFIISCQPLSEVNDTANNSKELLSYNDLGKIKKKCYLKFDNNSYKEYNLTPDSEKVNKYCNSPFNKGYYHNNNGPAYIEYHDNGNISYEYYFINGKIINNNPGRIYYRANGIKDSEFYFLTEDIHGPMVSLVYHKNGNLKYKTYFKKFIDIKHHSEYPAFTEYYFNGNKKEEKYYFNDYYHGGISYYESGSIKCTYSRIDGKIIRNCL